MSTAVARLRSLRTRLVGLRSAFPALLRWLQPHRLSVADKLKATLWVCGLGLVAIAGAYAWTGHASGQAARTQASYQRGSDLAAALATRVAEARRLQTQYARSFDDADRSQLLATQQELKDDLQALRAMPMDAGRRKALQSLAEAVDGFSQGIAALFERVDEMGRGDAGLAAQLQQAADALQANVAALQRPVLELHVQKMRRQEALLLLDGDSTHADRASEEKLPFDLALAGLPAEAQESLRTDMDAYQAALLGYTAARVGLCGSTVAGRCCGQRGAGIGRVPEGTGAGAGPGAGTPAGRCTHPERAVRRDACPGGRRADHQPGAGAARRAAPDPGHPALCQ